MSPQLARTTLIPQPTSSTQEDNHSTETIRRQRPNSELDEHYRKHQHTHMHTPTFTSAPAGPAHLSARPQATSRRTLRTNSGELQLVGAASSRPPGSARLPAHRRRRAPRSNSTQDEASRRTRSAARTACRSQFIISIALVATLALVLSGAGPRVAEAEAKPVSGQQQYQLVQFRRLPPKQFSAALGSSIIIECEAGAAPPPAIHWLRNGARIHQNDLDDNQLDDTSQQESLVSSGNSEQISLSSTRSRLFIDCASLADEATYTCVAENAFSRVSTHTTLKIIRPVQVDADLFGADNELGGELLPGGPLERADELELAGAGVAGPAPKRGPAALDLEAAEKSLSAVPQCLPNLHTSTTQAPLRIHMWTHNILERMKNSVLLYCRSNAAKPTITSQQSQEQQNNMNDDNSNNNHKNTLVTWTLPNDKQVEPNQSDKYEILGSGDLLIKDLRWSDMGSYICTVSNEQSSDSVSSFVYPSKRTWLVT